MKTNILDLADKISVVTGAGSGLGRVFCEALAEHGSHVVCADIDENSAKETARMLVEYGTKSMAVKADVSKQADVKELFRKVEEEFGRLDILFNNAGIATRGAKIHEMPLEDWNKVIDVNLTGTFLCLQEGLKLMLRQKSGSIINVSSVCGLIAVDPEILANQNYVASKHGIIGLTKAAAVQYAEDNIRVNAIAPGFFKGTRLAKVEERTEEQARTATGKVLALTPMKRFATPEELKGLAIFLASDAASSFITGATIVVDGGVCAW